MTVFRYLVGGQAPLQIQLGPVPSDRLVRVRGIFAYSDTGSGVSDEPVIYFPSTVGTGSNIFVSGVNNMLTSICPIITSFSGAPTFPTGLVNAASLPTRREFYLPRGSEIWVPEATALMLYAPSSGGHTWTGGFEWTEP